MTHELTTYRLITSRNPSSIPKGGRKFYLIQYHPINNITHDEIGAEEYDAEDVC
jgi:hypothetical protein